MIVNENFLKILIELMPDGIFVIDIEGKVILWNRFLEEITGVNKENIIGKDNFEYAIPFYGIRKPMPVDYIINPDMEPAEDINKRGNIIEVETFLHTLYGGKGAWVRLTAYPIIDDSFRLVGAVQIIRDITKRKIAEFELWKLKKVIDSAPVGVIITEFSGSIIYYNMAFLNYIGAVQIKGENIFSLLPFISLYEIHNGYLKEIKYKGRIFRLRGIRLEEEEVYGYAIFLTDITELRKYEEQVIISHKMESIRRITSTYTHDLKNIINAVRGFAQIALGRKDLEKAKSDMEKILKAIDSASDNIKRILDFGKDLGRNPEIIDLRDVVKGILPLLKSVLKEDIDLNIELEDTPIIVYADKSDIEKIILNLVLNSQDAMPEGGEIKIVLKRKPLPEKFIALKQEDMDVNKNYVCFTVCDTGVGMEESIKSKIFEPFFTTKGEKGSGLGLSTVYYIVQMLNGYIFVDSKINQGTRFDIYIPLKL